MPPVSKMRKMSQVGGGNRTERYNTNTGISAEVFSSQDLHCRDLIGHHSKKEVTVVEFSEDGSFFVSGGKDGGVLLWPTSKAIDDQWTPNPTVMKAKHHYKVICLALSSDNKRIFSGGKDNLLLIHDVET